MITETIDIPKHKKSYLKEKVEKINRKAVRMGCEPIELTFDNEHIIEFGEHPVTGHVLAFPLKLEMVTATLNYEIPIIEGWELVAKLDIYPSMEKAPAVVLVSAVPGMEVPNEYRNLDRIHCDHCGWNRNRHHSVLLRNVETGQHIQVGSTCVKDFFGLDPKAFLYMASIKFDSLVGPVSDDDDIKGNYGRSIFGYDLEAVLAYSAASTVKWGWMSKSKAWELNGLYGTDQYIPTADHVLDNLNPWPQMPEEFQVAITAEDTETAKKTMEYFENLDPDGNDYLENCVKIAKMGYVPYKYVGYACSMVSAYEREMNKRAAYEKKAEEGKASEHRGEVGERLKDIKVTVTYSRDFVNDWGDNTLYAFKDELGNVYKTFYGGTSWECEVDDVVIMAGTVKKHNTFRGVKETMLTRVAVKEAPKTDELISESEIAIA